MPATKADLLALCGRRRYRDVSLPVSGLTVRVQSLNEAENQVYLAACMDEDGAYTREKHQAARRVLMALSLVDDAGKRLLETDGEELDGLDRADSNAICAACYGLLGEATKSVEDHVKN